MVFWYVTLVFLWYVTFSLINLIFTSSGPHQNWAVMMLTTHSPHNRFI